MPAEPRAGGAPDRLMWAAATSLLVLPAVLPPEIHPWSAAACHALAAGAAFLLAGRSGGTASSMGSSWVLLFLPFAAASVLAAACRARAVDQAAAAAVLVLAGFLGRAQAGGVPIRRLTSILAALGSGAALLALTQHFITYPRLAAALRALDPADPTGALIRLEAGRPSGPFILPTALGGFLAMTLPASLVRAFGARTGATRAVAALAALLQILALGLSRSIGALGAATVGALLVLPALAPRRRGAAAAALVLLAGLCAAIVLGARRGEILARPGGDPVSLRAGNWGAAVRMIGEHPLFGVGPGSFGTFYPRQMRPGMNETRYAHNSYLQAMAAWGLWIAVPLGALIAAAVRSTRRCRRRSGDRLPLLAGGVAFLVHNLVDFTAYLPGVAIPASLALGAGMGDAPEKGSGRTRARARRPATALAALLLAAALAGHGWVASRCARLLGRARVAAESGAIDAAADLARRAAAVRPDDPGPHAFLAQLVLAERAGERAWREEGEAAASRALALDRESAILHYTRSLYYDWSGEPAPAYRERLAAHLLYPLKPLYRARGSGGGEAPP